MAGYKKNLRLVLDHLETDETIKYSVAGAYETDILGSDSIRNGILVATDRRIVFFAKKMFGHDFESFPFSSISSMQTSKGLMGKGLSFHASGNSVKMKYINAGQYDQFYTYVTGQIGTTPDSATTTVDVADQIKKLADLRDQGILTDDEFQTKKTDLLRRM